MFPTGDTTQPTNVTVTLTVPTNPGDEADDFILDAVTGSLLLLTDPATWDDNGYVITAAAAAAMGQAVFNSITIT